jgi:hypothetical protein
MGIVNLTYIWQHGLLELVGLLAHAALRSQQINSSPRSAKHLHE